MVWRWLWRISDALVGLVFVVVLVALLIVFFPMYAMVSLVETISGEGRWCRRQRQRMVFERPPMPDAEFVEAAHVQSEDVYLWLAVRHAVADSIGLPSEAIYPVDQMSDLFRMQFSGPDVLEVVLQLEKSLGVEIPSEALEPFDNTTCELQQYTAGVVSSLRDIRPKHSILQETLDIKGIPKG